MGSILASIFDKFKVAVWMLIFCIAFIAMVGVTAYSSKLQYDINTINKSIQSTQREIQTLQVKIRSASNINNLEEKAIEMGMVYPTFDQIVYLQVDPTDIPDLAMALKVSVYQ